MRAYACVRACERGTHVCDFSRVNIKAFHRVAAKLRLNGPCHAVTKRGVLDAFGRNSAEGRSRAGWLAGWLVGRPAAWRTAFTRNFQSCTRRPPMPCPRDPTSEFLSETVAPGRRSCAFLPLSFSRAIRLVRTRSIDRSLAWIRVFRHSEAAVVSVIRCETRCAWTRRTCFAQCSPLARVSGAIENKSRAHARNHTHAPKVYSRAG